MGLTKSLKQTDDPARKCTFLTIREGEATSGEAASSGEVRGASPTQGSYFL